MNVKFYSLSSLPTANANAAGSFVHVTSESAMYYCDGAKFIKLDNVAQDKAGEVKSAVVNASTGIVSFKNASNAELFTLALADYITAEVSKLTGSANIASVADGVVTIKAAVAEADGKISNGAGSDVVLAKVATTGKATDITLDPSLGLNNGEKKANVQDAIATLVTAFDGLVTDTEAAIASAVSAEASRAKDAEDALASKVSALEAKPAAAITAEQISAWNGEVGALAATSVNATAIASVSSALSDAVASISANTEAIGSNTEAIASVSSALADAVASISANDAAIKAETSRAEGVETSLAARISALEDDSADAEALASEVSRAKAAELALAGRLDVVEGDGEGSIKKAAADAVAEVVAGADSDFDTLKEVADWIAADKTRAAELQVTVASNTANITSVSSAVSAEASRAKDAEAALSSRLDTLEENPAAEISADQISAWDAVAASKASYDAHVSNADIHVTTEDKATWNAKQDAFDNADVLASITAAQVSEWDAAAEANHTHANASVLDAITETKVSAWDAVAASKSNYDAHVSNADIHVTTEDKTSWNAVADAKDDYDAHVSNADIHVSAEDKEYWNGIEESLIGTDSDTAASDTISGAKKYTDAALTWLTEWPNA